MQTLDQRQNEKKTGKDLAEESGVIDLDTESVEGMDELAAELESTAEGFSVDGFKCSNCGLAHGHNTDKHRSSDSFSMNHEQAGNMEASPNCHCGAHELAARGSEYGVDEDKAASTAGNAPVPDSVHKQFQ